MSFKTLFAITSLVTTLSGTYAALTRRVSCPDGVNTATNEACCAFFALRDDLQSNLFENECGEEVRGALRLTFHDGIAFSPTLGGGGADGSILTFSDTELTFAANGGNGGVEDFVTTMVPFLSRHNVSAGDLVHFAGALGITNCEGTPRVQFFAGRPNAVAAAPDGLVSQPGDPIDTIIERFADAGFSTDELVSLLASHSISAADTITGANRGAPFDSTNHVFDSQFFIETRLHSAVPGEGRLPSDVAIARDDRTSCLWQSFITDEDAMRNAFGAGLTKLSLTGQDVSQLVDCSELIPQPAAHVPDPFFPGTATITDVDAACTQTPFPALTQNPAVTSVAHVNEF
ncbi:manganese peroxidase [Fomitiporia mediterranea MF3/22]|uniref:manganese peroxidase n=1 Tax=Fomitiporia mediterranea (strain MF3/22) TaxID=694068 RepID=UPI0004407AC9|nr:manganese peroxidase [Fomitiporia mediterranea MF3/22]EJD07919.1 manganese peroxidase [Fomitiporia mediterranea MF3/22]